jgi:hypothetical protein
MPLLVQEGTVMLARIVFARIASDATIGIANAVLIERTPIAPSLISIQHG